MNYHKWHRKKQCLTLFLAGSLFFGGMPVYAQQNAEIEFSSSQVNYDDYDSQTVESTDESSLTIDPTDEELTVSPDEPDYTSDENASDNAFSSDNSEADFSSGNTASDDEPDYILGRPMTKEERQAQLAPMENLTSETVNDTVKSDLDIATYALYPGSYDARNDNLVTTVKNQGNLNLCWAFSLASNFETSLLSRRLGDFDLSEEHLAYFWAHRINDPLGNTPDDQIIRTSNNYHGTGNGQVASFFLSTWSGMTTESKVPLSTTAVNWPDSLAYDTDAYMENAVFSQYSVDRVKQLLEEYHSVSAMINMESAYYCPDTAAYNYPVIKEKKTVNHAVTIIGWDDDYSKNNFTETSDVQDNGAWIVKNSYGSSWGKDGYFYLSYEDQSISNLVCNTAVTSPAYPNNYFYDGATVGTVSFPSSSVSGGYYVSNIFRATAGNGNDEELGEIVTAVPQDNTQFQVQIYTDLQDSSNPASGTPAYTEPLDYTQPLAGIHTIKLDTPVKIAQNTQYSIVLKILDGSQKYYVEKSTSSNPLEPEKAWFKVTAGIDPNQSFYSRYGQTWTDAGATSSGYCFSIKAHTKTLDTSTTVTPSPDPDETPVITPEITPDIEEPDDIIIEPEPSPTPVSYQVSYQKNTSLGVMNLPSSVSVQSGNAVTIGSAPYCNSRFFTGWNTRADGKGKSYAPGQKISLKQNLTLYAQWSYSYTSSSKLKYRVTGKQTVTCYGTSNSKIKKVSVPVTIKYKGITYRVTSVYANAFKNKTHLTTVSIGNNVSVIGKNAFYKCKNLKKVTIGTGLTQINAYAFRGVKKGCTITIKSQKLKKVASRIDQSVSRMTVRVPKKKYSAYKKLLRKKSKSVIIKKF